jgi:hypothetical protein
MHVHMEEETSQHIMLMNLHNDADIALTQLAR